MDLAETVMALALLYALLSVVASAAKEAIEAGLQKRKQNFKGAVEELLGFAGAQAFLEHPRIRAIISRTGEAVGTKSRHWPSYVDAETFAAVAQEIIDRDPDGQLAQLRAWAKGRSAVVKAEEELALLQKAYAERMERLSGSFKRNAQAWLMGIGLLLAGFVDADTLQMARQLANDSTTRAALVKLAEQTTSPAAVQALCGTQQPQDLLKCVRDQSPVLVGWSAQKWEGFVAGPWWAWPFKALGYVLTAVAISLGAAFWFDLIGKVANIRATAKPNRA